MQYIFEKFNGYFFEMRLFCNGVSDETDKTTGISAKNIIKNDSSNRP